MKEHYQVQTKKKLAVAVTAMSIAAVGGGIGAAGAQAQNEVLTGTATTVSGGSSGLCLGNNPANATVTFNAAGSSAAPYSGTFTETNASSSLYRNAGHTQLMLSIPFAISSGTTTIKGTITNPSPYTGGNAVCGSSFYIFGIGVAANTANYTTTIKRSGHPAQTVRGTAQISGGFDFRPYGLPHTSTVTETLLNFPSS